MVFRVNCKYTKILVNNLLLKAEKTLMRAICVIFFIIVANNNGFTIFAMCCIESDYGKL